MEAQLITDASFCPKTKAAGWAAWCKSERGFIKQCGDITSPVGCNNQAELCAIAQGLMIAISASIIQTDDHVVIQTDSHFAVTRLGKKRANYFAKRDMKRKVLLTDSAKVIIQGLMNDYNLSFELRLIPGHTCIRGRDDKDELMSWADRASRSRMRARQKPLLAAMDLTLAVA